MLQIGLCDDHPDFHEKLCPLLEQTLDQLHAGRYTLDLYTDMQALTGAVENGTQYHILLLDIVLEGEENGIEAAVRLQRAHDVRASIIFVSAYPQYAIESFEASPLYFLTKPVAPDKLRKALRNALKKWEEQATLEVTDVAGTLHAVRLGDLEYIEIYDKRFVLHMGAGREGGEAGEIICRSGLEDLLKRLEEPRFFRSHRNFLVNMGNVCGITKESLQMRGGADIPIARRKYEDALLAYTRNRGGAI